MRGWMLLVVVVSGCYRGCSCQLASEPAKHCDDSSDCGKGTSCRGGYCVSNETVRLEDECRQSEGCAENGACTLVNRRSFLGLDPGTECAATTDDECKQAHACKVRGACSRGPGDVGCAVVSENQCKASERCATNEECTLDSFQCVRDWSNCPHLIAQGTPSWADSVRLDWEYDFLRTPWQPGTIEQATLACRIEATGKGRGAMRIADRCTIGPSPNAIGLGTSLVADVPLHVGETITAVVQEGARSRPYDTFIQIAYRGASPMHGTDGTSQLECVVVPRSVALERSKRELAAVDGAITAAAREKITIARPQAMSGTIVAGRVHAERAAMWLGWSSPELGDRVARLDRAQLAYETQLDAVVHSAPTTTSPMKLGAFEVTLLGQVCGADLRARHGSGSDDCALAFAIDNASAKPRSLYLQLVWAQPAHDDKPAVVAPAEVIERTVGDAHPAYFEALEPGERATVLVGGYAEGAILVGDLGTATFALKPRSSS